MPHLSKYTMLDYTGEKSTITVYNGPVTVGTIASFLTAFSGLKTAILGITLGNAHQEEWVGDRTLLTNASPSNQNAQRENKWLVRYRGNSGQKLYQLEIPTADLTGVTLLPQSDFADMAASPMSAFISAFEAMAKSPDSDSETVTVESVQFVGRNI